MRRPILLAATLAALACPLTVHAADKVLMYTGNGGNAGYGFSQVEAGVLAAGATAFDATTTWPADLSEYRVVFLFLNETSFTQTQIDQIDAFRDDGGLLGLIVDHTTWYEDSIDVMNGFLTYYGADSYFTPSQLDAGCAYGATVNDATHPLTYGISEVYYAYSSTIAMGGDGEELATGASGQAVLAYEDGLLLSSDGNMWNDACAQMSNNVDFYGGLFTGWCDMDQDGYDKPICGGDDCDDDDPAIHSEETWYEDYDGDGYGDADSFVLDCSQPTGYVANDEDCDDDDIDINPGATETRNAEDDDCDGYYDEGLLELGDLIVTEIMKDPSAVNDEYGEWFEVFNASAWDINLIGGTVYDLDGDSFTVDSDLWILSGMHGVLVRNADVGVNGGVAGDFEYGSWPLANGSDEIELEHFGVILDTVVFSDPTWPDDSGESMSLDPDEYDETANDSADNWCGGQDIFGQGDLGSPGDLNPDCCPDLDGDGFANIDCGGLDCDDTNSLINPDASEVCNGVDDNCDGNIDEGLPTTIWYPDGDGDGYGDASATPVEDCLVIADHVDNNEDCDDGDAAINPDATEMCDGVDNDCDGDVDEDDAADALTFYEDADGDTYGNIGSTTQACSVPQGYVTNFIDCDDGDPNQYPGADELCNGEDDDCDGDVDEDEAIDVLTWYEDSDGDGYGNAAVTDIDCEQPDGFVGNDEDCNDAAAVQYPGADEYCNNEDDDCDGDVDEDDALDAQTWWADADGDGFGDAAVEEVTCYQPQDFVGNADDCDDGDSNQYPGADELCNGEDDDCDGDVDEDEALDALTWYEDLDADGFGDAAVTAVACAAPPDFVDNPDDCDPTDGAQFPGADEYCNGEDDDCDGDIDEDDAVDAPTWYVDNDGDGFGSNFIVDVACDQPQGFVDNDLDCQDNAAAVNPAAEEICNGIDDDCDALTDELADGDGDTFSICDGDCDDENPDVNPDAEEVCDGIDNDCDPATDEEGDADGDFYTICADDCDDDEPAMFPGNPEVCDLLDNDCDGVLPADEIDDDGDGMTECEGDCDDDDVLTYDGAPEQCDQIDNDCDGVVDNGADEDLDADGYNACQGDCDNNDPNVYPGATEICDGKDDDCDGNLPTEEADADGDGWMVCDMDCDDNDADLNLDDVDGDLWTTCDGDCDDDDAALNLDDVDGDLWATCDGDCDDDDAALNLDDVDGDLWTTCDGDCDDDDADLNLDDADADGYSSCDGDCDDADGDVHPDAAEECDGVDNDCDGNTDDVDADGDGHPAEDCGGDDCDDGDAAVNPDEVEICDDEIDNDCDGDIDAFDVECEDSGDDDTTGDDDDDDTPEDCSCQNNQADTRPAALPFLLTTALAVLAIRRRR